MFFSRTIQAALAGESVENIQTAPVTMFNGGASQPGSLTLVCPWNDTSTGSTVVIPGYLQLKFDSDKHKNYQKLRFILAYNVLKYCVGTYVPTDVVIVIDPSYSAPCLYFKDQDGLAKNIDAWGYEDDEQQAQFDLASLNAALLEFHKLSLLGTFRQLFVCWDPDSATPPFMARDKGIFTVTYEYPDYRYGIVDTAASPDVPRVIEPNNYVVLYQPTQDTLKQFLEVNTSQQLVVVTKSVSVPYPNPLDYPYDEPLGGDYSVSILVVLLFDADPIYKSQFL